MCNMDLSGSHSAWQRTTSKASTTRTLVIHMVVVVRCAGVAITWQLRKRPNRCERGGTLFHTTPRFTYVVV